MAEGYRALAADFGPRLKRVLVQPMLTGGVEVMIGVVQEPVFGPLVVFGSGGATTDVLGDHVTRLTPLTDADADEMIHAVRAAPLLFGHRGTPPVDTAALADALLRVSRLADDLPEVSELDLNPVVARAGRRLLRRRAGADQPRQSPGIPSCAGCAEHAATHRQPTARAADHTGISARSPTAHATRHSAPPASPSADAPDGLDRWIECGTRRRRGA